MAFRAPLHHAVVRRHLVSGKDVAESAVICVADCLVE